MAFAVGDLVVDVADVLALPGGMVMVADDDVGGLHERPFQILVGRLPHVAEAGLSAAGVDGGHDTGVAGELAWSAEAVDGSDLAFDDDGENVAHPRQGLQELDGGGEGDSLSNPIFELTDLLLEAVEGLEFLGDTAAGLRGKPRQGTFEPAPAGTDEDVAVLCTWDPVLGQGSVDTVLQGGAELGEGHAGAVELSFVADLPGR
jgi:hypothetical protein